MQILRAEQMIDCRAGIFIVGGWELPSWPASRVALRVWLDNTDIDEICEAL